MASEEPLLPKKILDHTGASYTLINKSLVKDYGAENSYNAMKIKEQELYQTKKTNEKY